MIVVSACLAGVSCKYDGGHNCVGSVEQWARQGKAVLVCPEQLGGLGTPRLPAEIQGGSGEDVLVGAAKVVDQAGRDVTAEFLKGAFEALRLARAVGATEAVLKESSPSCGSGRIHDGTFQGVKKTGQGVTAALLRHYGIRVRSEEQP